MEDNPLVPRRRKEDMPSGRLRKGLYILPSLFTTANIAAGYYAILQVVHGSLAEPWHLDNAAKAIGFAVLFDGLDGRIARMTRTSSDFGRELDSLADVIAFGGGHGLVEPHHDLAGRNMVAIIDQYRGDDSGLQRLDRLGTPGRHHLSGSAGNDVDFPQDGPADGKDNKKDKSRGDRPPDWRRGCLHDLQRRRKKLELRAPCNAVRTARG